MSRKRREHGREATGSKLMHVDSALDKKGNENGRYARSEFMFVRITLVIRKKRRRKGGHRVEIDVL